VNTKVDDMVQASEKKIEAAHEAVQQKKNQKK
jgi:hypothetical protein